MTVFDPSALHRLVDGAEGRPFALDLIRTYRRMLDQRVARLLAAVLASDPEESMDAVLSIKVASTMTGAGEIAELTGFIEADLRSGDLPSARAQALLLPAAAARAEAAIERYVEQAEICA